MYPKEPLSVLDKKLNHVVVSPFVTVSITTLWMCNFMYIITNSYESTQSKLDSILVCVIFHKVPSAVIKHKRYTKNGVGYNMCSTK